MDNWQPTNRVPVFKYCCITCGNQFYSDKRTPYVNLNGKPFTDYRCGCCHERIYMVKQNLAAERLFAAEVNSIINHLASLPGVGHATATREQLRKILLDTGGELLLIGCLYSITSKHLGAGIYKVSTKKLA